MKKNALIVTITSFNCGNRLQNYALSTLLKKYVNDVRTLSCTLICGSKRKFISNLPSAVSAFILRTLSILIKPFDAARSKKLRAISFFYTFDKNIKFEKTPPRHKFDYYVAGSDQIWNTSFNLNRDYIFLNFDDGVKIAYAASMGMKSLSADDRALFSEKLKTFNAVSVRENDAKQLLAPLCDKNISVVLDPTLMLTSSEWDKLVVRPKYFDITGEYIFRYTLGADTIIPENLINDPYIPVWNFFDDSDKKYIGGPSEFLWLIKHAKYILTDSFHAIVFSLLYHKPFVLLSNSASRSGMNGRFETLFNKFGLDMEKITDKTYPYLPDYSSVDKLLNNERQKSLAFLNEAFNDK